MVNYLIFGTFLHAAIPGVPKFIWILGMIILVTFVNVRGVKLATKVNFLINAFSALFIILFCFFLSNIWLQMKALSPCLH